MHFSAFLTSWSVGRVSYVFSLSPQEGRSAFTSSSYDYDGHRQKKLWEGRLSRSWGQDTMVCTQWDIFFCHPLPLFATTALLFYFGGVLLAYTVWSWWVCRSCGPTNSTIRKDIGVRMCTPLPWSQWLKSNLFSTWSTKGQLDFFFRIAINARRKEVGFFPLLLLAAGMLQTWWCWWSSLSSHGGNLLRGMKLTQGNRTCRWRGREKPCI